MTINSLSNYYLCKPINRRRILIFFFMNSDFYKIQIGFVITIICTQFQQWLTIRVVTLILFFFFRPFLSGFCFLVWGFSYRINYFPEYNKGKKEKVFLIGQSFLLNWVWETSSNLIYKNDMYSLSFANDKFF
jgi:hypothetical protein